MFQRFRQFVTLIFGAKPPREAMQEVRGSYDAARSSDEYKNAWANADQYDADSAHSRQVRHTLIQRSRYEIGSNGFSDGIAVTYATDVIGAAPVLRMQTGSPGFNRMVENAWYFWTKAVGFRRKLWCMAHAKHSDGEAFATLRRNPRVNNPIRIDFVLHEAEQVQTPFIPFNEPGYIDGLKFDEFGNPLWFDILQQHPGASNLITNSLVPERVPADRVLHWFKMRRPGQHRAVAECSSTLNVGIAHRRFREATIAAAETAAEHAAVVKTTQQPDAADEVRPFTTWDITKRMMTFLPMGWDMGQLKSEHPNAGYGEFNKSLVSELARPKSMSYNRAACDSSGSNFASGKLDFLPYFSQIDAVDREDCNDLVLDPLFESWFDMAVVRFQWLGGDPSIITPNAKAHLWDWPKHDAADVQSEANANKTRLSTGELSLGRLYREMGRDFEDDLPEMASEYGVTPDEMREILRTAIFNAQNQQASMESAAAQTTQAEKQPAKPAPTKQPAPADGSLPINRLLKANGGANGHAIHQ